MINVTDEYRSALKPWKIVAWIRTYMRPDTWIMDSVSDFTQNESRIPTRGTLGMKCLPTAIVVFHNIRLIYDINHCIGDPVEQRYLRICTITDSTGKTEALCGRHPENLFLNIPVIQDFGIVTTRYRLDLKPKYDLLKDERFTNTNWNEGVPVHRVRILYAPESMRYPVLIDVDLDPPPPNSPKRDLEADRSSIFGDWFPDPAFSPA